MVFNFKKAPIQNSLAIISIIGFLAIFIGSVTSFGDVLDAVSKSILFIIIGLALSILGGIRLFFKRFADGLSNNEISKLISVIIGVFSIIVGILILPFPFLRGVQDAPFIKGLQIIISVLAIIIIFVDNFVSDLGK